MGRDRGFEGESIDNLLTRVDTFQLETQVCVSRVSVRGPRVGDFHVSSAEQKNKL